MKQKKKRIRWSIWTRRNYVFLIYACSIAEHIWLPIANEIMNMDCVNAKTWRVWEYMRMRVIIITK